VKFGFIVKHRGVWPANWMCEALGVSRGGFYAWLTRPRSRRSRTDEELGAKVRASFLGSDSTYGARRVWKDLAAEGVFSGLHRIERLMRSQAFKARPRRRRLPPDWRANRMRNKLPMHLSPRCGARTRSRNSCGARTRSRNSCQAPAMPNGRCRMHGGMSPGAPKGNKNALKHGLYTAEAIARRRHISGLIRAMKSSVRNH
jgi:transposase InsO family protein